MPWRDALKTAVIGNLEAPFEGRVWMEIATGVCAVLLIVLRLLLLMVLPFTVLLTAWLIRRYEMKTARNTAEARARLRRWMHQNGPAE